MTQRFGWTGRDDPGDGTMTKRWHHVVRRFTEDFDHDDCIGGIVGFACDLGVERNQGRLEARLGPDAVRKELAGLAWHGGQGTLIDYGNISLPETTPVGDPLAAGQAKLGEQVDAALRRSGPALVIGGGHETAVGSFGGLLEYYADQPGQRLGIINLDTHFDLREPGSDGATSGTPFHQIRQTLEARGQEMNYLCLGIAETSNTLELFDRARRWGAGYLLDRELRPHLMVPVWPKIDNLLEHCDVLYLSLDLDVLPHWQMPAVSAPAAHGVGIEVVEDIIEYLADKRGAGKVSWPLSDVVEFNPQFDQDGRAARVAARLCAKLMRAMMIGI